MRDEQDRPWKRLERRLQRLAALEVEMVGRLVQHEQVRPGRHHDGQGQPSPLSTREHGHLLLVLAPAGEEKAAEQLLCLRPRRARSSTSRIRARCRARRARRRAGRSRRAARRDRSGSCPQRAPLARAASRAASSCRIRSGRRARRARRARARACRRAASSFSPADELAAHLPRARPVRCAPA